MKRDKWRKQREEKLTQPTRSDRHVTNFDLPAGQRPVCSSFRLQVCRNLAVLQRELALQSSHIQKDGRDKLGLVQNPLPILKLETHREGGEARDFSEKRAEKICLLPVKIIIKNMEASYFSKINILILLFLLYMSVCSSLSRWGWGRSTFSLTNSHLSS